jgi:inosose dehydratase
MAIMPNACILVAEVRNSFKINYKFFPVMTARRDFLKITATAIGGSTIAPLLGNTLQHSVVDGAAKPTYHLGFAGYTFREFSIEQSIAMMKKVGIHTLTLKDFHLPLNSTPEKTKEVLGQFAAAGISVYGVGVIYMRSQAEVDKTFAYAKQAGVGMIVGVPSYDLLTYTEQKVKEYNIKMAIHNHGPEDKLYPAPKDVWDRIKNMDARMGLCIDIGHAIRAGADPAKVVKDYKSRLFDMHIKDVTLAEQNGKAIEVGRGVINFPALIKALNKVKFTGACSIEFEKDMKDPLAGIAESVGYFRGVMKALS